MGAKYVAIGALFELLTADGNAYFTEKQAGQVAEMLVEQAWDVEHYPVAGKVQITLDLSRLDQPAEPDESAHP